tara:strand:- start:222 stop:398 length:177 start_codon:yes stop_codon:yes gene_type:complete
MKTFNSYKVDNKQQKNSNETFINLSQGVTKTLLDKYKIKEDVLKRKDEKRKIMIKGIA